MCDVIDLIEERRRRARRNTRHRLPSARRGPALQPIGAVSAELLRKLKKRTHHE